MNTKLKIALGLAFTAFAFTANAQKTLTQGLATYSLHTKMGDVETKLYFTTDSSAAITSQGPAVVKFLGNAKSTYASIVVDVPSFSVKKVATLTPDEIDQFLSSAPKFTFTPTAETKVINGFNCKKVNVKDSKSGKEFVGWITNDIVAPTNSMTKLFADAGGFPVQFTTFQQGQFIDVTLKTITGDKAPAGTFTVGPGYDKITLDELMSLMRGGR